MKKEDLWNIIQDILVAAFKRKEKLENSELKNLFLRKYKETLEETKKMILGVEK